MDGKQDLFVNAVEHHAVVTVDEYGTQAAAATGVVAQFVSRPLSVTVTLDRPFTFVIQDDATGEMLFLDALPTPPRTKTPLETDGRSREVYGVATPSWSASTAVANPECTPESVTHRREASRRMMIRTKARRT